MKRAFTLIELLVVIAIVAILMAIPQDYWLECNALDCPDLDAP